MEGRRPTYAELEKKYEALSRDCEELKQSGVKGKSLRYGEILDNMIEGVQVIGPDWRYLYVNKAVVGQSGYSAEELYGHTMIELYPGVGETELFRHLLLCLEEQTARHIENRFVYPDGSARWFDLSIQPVPEGILVLSVDITDRKLNEIALQTNEERIRRLIAAVPLPLSYSDNKGNVEYVNNKFTEVFGYETGDIRSVEEWMVKAYPDVKIRKSALNAWLSFAENAVEGESRQIPGEFPVICKDGTQKEILFNASFIDNHFLVTFSDLTERKEAAMLLLEAKNNFESLFENTPVSIWQEDFTDVVNYFNELKLKGKTDLRKFLVQNPGELYKIAGLINVITINRQTVKLYRAESKEDLIRNLPATFLPETLEVFKEELIALAEGATSYKAKTKVQALDGEVLDVIVRLFTQQHGSRYYAYVTTIDVTDLSRAEAEIRKLNEGLEESIRIRTAELADLYNNAPCGYHSVDKNGIIVQINNTELRWLGYERDEIVEKAGFFDLITPESLHVFKENFPKFKERGWMSDLEFDMVRKDGSVFSVLLAATAIYDANGDFCMSRSTIIDITERKRADIELKTYQKQLEVLNRDLEAFAYSVSHDLRAPLRHIDGFARLIQQAVQNTSPDIDRYFRKINESAARMAVMIDDLLSFSRLGRRDIHKTKVDLNGLIERVVPTFATETENRKVEWIISRLPVVMADASLLQLVFENLISNALKFTSKNEIAIIEIGCSESDRCQQVFVKDNGVGFDMKYADKLFGVFQRLHANEEFEGTGIGLANVKQIVSRHGASITAYGEPGKGASFTIEFNKS